MSIVRVKKDAKYFTASNEPFNDKRLSWEARGLMGFLLSKPNNWQIRMDNLEKSGKAGNYKLRRMLAELRQCGYMNRIRVTIERGKFDWITEVYESPSQNPNPSKVVVKAKKSASGGFSTSGSSTSGELPDIVSTDSLNTDKKHDEDDALAQISRAYESEIGTITPVIADELREASAIIPLQWTLDAIHEAAIQNKRGWKYVSTILTRWKTQGNQEEKKPQYQSAKKTTVNEPSAFQAIRDYEAMRHGN